MLRTYKCVAPNWKLPSYIAVLQTQQILGCHLGIQQAGLLLPKRPPKGTDHINRIPLIFQTPNHGSVKNCVIWKITTNWRYIHGRKGRSRFTQIETLKNYWNLFFPNLWWDLHLQSQTKRWNQSNFAKWPQQEELPQNIEINLFSGCYATLRIKTKGLRYPKQHLLVSSTTAVWYVSSERSSKNPKRKKNICLLEPIFVV